MKQASTYSVFRDVLASLGAKYKNVVVLSLDSGSGSPADRFRKLFPARHFHLGNASSQTISLAAGMAVSGKIPLVCGNELFSCSHFFHQMQNLACPSNLNIKIIGMSVSFYEDIAILRPLPNMKIACPADTRECQSACEVMLEDFGPMYLRLSNDPVPRIYDDTYQFSFGKINALAEGDDAIIFAAGSSVSKALQASSLLREGGIYVAVVNVASIKPIDTEGITAYASRTQCVFTLEDHNIVGGLGSAISEILSEKSPRCVYRMGFDLNSEDVSETIQKILGEKCHIFQKSALPL